jgi:flagellar motor switch protein FliM
MSLRVLDETAAQPFAFKRADHIADEQLQTLNLIHDRLAKAFSASMSASLRATVEVTLMETIQAPYADFAANAAKVSCCAALSMLPLDGTTIVEIRPDLAFAMIDRLLGGEGRAAVPAERPLTDIEKNIMQGPLRTLAQELAAAWKRTHAIDFKIGATESAISALRGPAATERVIAVEFRFRLNAEDSKMRIALPAPAIDPLFKASGDEARSRRVQQDENLIRQIRRVPVNISIETPETQFPLRSVVALQPGDTLLLDQRDEWPLLLKVAGITKMQAQARTDTKRKAFTIIARNRAGIEDFHEFSNAR